MKTCCVCGKEIKDDDFYYGIDYKTFCCSEECFDIYHWSYIVNHKNDYAIIEGQCYRPGEYCDNSKFSGLAGRKITLFWNDKMVVTENLNYIGKVPRQYRLLLPNNAFIYDLEANRNDK